jgi:hypothetical protein
VVVVIAVAVEVAVDAVSHKAMALIHKKDLMVIQRILRRIQKKVQRARHIVVAVAVVQLVKM